MNPFDVVGAVGPVLRKTGDTPLSFAGRLLGLGVEEQRVGVPKWAWFGVGLVAGSTLALLYGDKVKDFAGSLRR